MRKGRCLHFIYQASTKQAGAGLASHGRVVDYKVMNCAARIEFDILVHMLREEGAFVVTEDDFASLKRDWEFGRRNMHYCNSKVAEWTAHCHHGDRVLWSVLDALKMQAAIYHGILNEEKYT